MNDILTISEHQEIYVAHKRDIKNNTISDEDKNFLFEIVHHDKQKKERYVFSRKGKDKIKANSIVGSISLKTGLTVEILPKFAKNDLDEEAIKKHRKMLLNILRVSNEKNFISSASQSSKVLVDEMPLLHYVIELFSTELLHMLRSGIYATYNKKVENSSHIKGNVLLSKTLQNNIIDKSKVYISYNKHSFNNLLMQVFRTLAKILLNDNNLSYKAKQTLHEVYLLLDGVDIIPLKQRDFKSITFNRLNDKFEILFKQAEFIFNRYMPFSSHINSSPFWSILFDMNYLFEKFCAYLFRKSSLEIEEQSMTKCFENHKYDVSAKPDFIIKENKNLFDTEIINVVDAKWKLLSSDKSLYGLDAQNFWQLFSYMNLLNQDKELHGYFIVPKNSEDFEDEIIFKPIKEGNKSITILSIDFSLNFEELIQKYRFRILNNELKLDVQVIEEILEENLLMEEEKEEFIAVEENIEKKFKFNLEDFIEELEVLSNNKNIRKILSPNKKDDRFKNLFYLKDIYNANSQAFKISVKENLSKNSWDFEGLDIEEIPNNIIKLKNLIRLNLSKNNIKILYDKILNLKSLKILSIDKNIIEDNLKIIHELRKNRVIIQDEEGNNLSEYITSLIPIDEMKSLEVELNSNELEDNISNEIEIFIPFNKKDIEKYYANDYQTLKSFANTKNLADEYKIILFYRDYLNVSDKYEIQNILKENSSEDLKKLFETSIHDFISLLENKFNEISKKFKYMINGFTYCNNNSALFKIKTIIAKCTNNQDLINELSNQTNEKKIIFAILSNFNKNEIDEYVVNNHILEKIFFNSIDNLDCKIAIAILKRKELKYSLFSDILEHCHEKIDLIQFKNNDYIDTEIIKYIKNILTPNFNNMTLERYIDINDNDKINFFGECDFLLIEDSLIRAITKESNIDLLEDFTYNQTLPLKYLILTYTYNSDKDVIKENIKIRDKNLYDMINRNIYGLIIYIENNFNTINKEILLGFAMNQEEKFERLRIIISQLSTDLDILDELSKNKNDKQVLFNIVFKTKNNEEFKKKIINQKTIYSTIILDRISKYEEYYEFGNKTCLIIRLAHNFSLTEQTKEYFLEKYHDDRILLETLSQNNSPWELSNKIDIALSILNNINQEQEEEESYERMNPINLEYLKEKN